MEMKAEHLALVQQAMQHGALVTMEEGGPIAQAETPPQAEPVG